LNSETLKLFGIKTGHNRQFAPLPVICMADSKAVYQTFIIFETLTNNNGSRANCQNVMDKFLKKKYYERIFEK